MERRGFLKGIFGGVTAAWLVVVAAPDEIAAFASPLTRNAPLLLDVPNPQQEAVHFGEHLYNADGELVAIVQSVSFNAPSIDVTSAFDTNRTFVRDLPKMEIIATGIGRMELNPSDSRGIRLRGMTERDYVWQAAVAQK